ncbi:MAG: sulfite exporter TauE/SafE family protein [Hyphomicrobiaceae bacterium]|nr:MAG: sulfite exporter TauE/SafE family protein [Hyphomicrobiaceae bacterium]
MWDDILLYVAVGFAAQMIDGAIGMAYGVTASSVLLSAGVPPAAASACVHAAEVFTTGASGYAHWRLGNVDRRLVMRLVLPGMIGGALGAYALASLPGEMIRPWVSAYLLVLGLVILWKAFRTAPIVPPAGTSRVAPLGFCGGFLDAIGGGGWGPLVASTLLGNGAAPRTVIGSVNLAEFFVTLTISATFVATIGLSLWPIVAGLVVGGVIAAPFAALATKHLPDRVLMVIVAIIVITLSCRTILKALG